MSAARVSRRPVIVVAYDARDAFAEVIYFIAIRRRGQQLPLVEIGDEGPIEPIDLLRRMRGCGDILPGSVGDAVHGILEDIYRGEPPRYRNTYAAAARRLIEAEALV
ncbi:hypothetical protein [Neoroseomonas soli]|uniref:Uncharacterized protein n=1 Tax=Neoroseomonas soli TaxID=1081025 RepID=A0A9X9WVH5_9PROT|nr:hypothetical protein [Neoroseomonas soli]MBR0671154.1 hypothetical protein [Neoroseomonas soli]